MIHLAVYAVVSGLVGIWLGHYLTAAQIVGWSLGLAVIIALPAGVLLHFAEFVFQGTVGKRTTGQGFLVGAALPLSFIVPACLGGLLRKKMDTMFISQGEG